MPGLKRKSSSSSVEGFVYAPSNEDYLGDIHQCRQEPLCTAMNVNREQFCNLTLSLRTLANDTLDLNLPWNDQDKDIRARFLAEVNERYPIFGARYQDAWPVRVYLRRFLDNRAKRLNKISKRAALDGGSERGHVFLNIQSYIPKPRNVDQLLDSTEREFRETTDFNKAQFRSMQSLLQSLARKHLDIHALYEDQNHHQLRLVVREASKAEPSFSTKYEGAWPVHVYLKRYLRERVQGATANPSSQTGAEQSSAVLSHALPTTQSARTNGCAYRYPPMQPVHSQFTWSPANFSNNSSLPSTSSTHGQTRGAGEAILPPITRASSSLSDDRPASDKENAPPNHVPPPMSAPDPSAPVKEFLRSLNPSLEHLLDRFRELGIENLETLLAFKTWSTDERQELFKGELNKLQLLAVQNFLRKV